MFLNEGRLDKHIPSGSDGSKRAPQGKLREGIVISLRGTEPRVHRGWTDAAVRDEFPDTRRLS